jgi:hypothetical protein
MPEQLEYESPKPRQPRPPLTTAATVCVALAFGIAVHGCAGADGNRLLSEGGDQYWIGHFPFLAVWTASGLAIVLGIAALLRRENRAHVAVLLLVPTLMLMLWSIRSYVANSQGIMQRHPADPTAVPPLRWSL